MLVRDLCWTIVTYQLFELCDDKVSIAELSHFNLQVLLWFEICLSWQSELWR